jgi:SAM-dependent methyltransferase
LILSLLSNAKKIIVAIRSRLQFRLIFDRERSLGNFELPVSSVRTNLNKEEVSRKAIFSKSGLGLNFLDVGGRDGELTYLLGIRGNLNFDKAFYLDNLAAFNRKYNYFGMDLLPSSDSKVIFGDACDADYVSHNESFRGFFDVIYSNNVFEHFEKPWIAAANLSQLLKPGGIIITIVPFAQRYHESPSDYFRYTHKGVETLFTSVGDFEVLESGYDIFGRRINWHGGGGSNDICPVDAFGAWRETWYTVSVLLKTVRPSSASIDE